MNRRFLLKFFKYLAVYLSLTIIIAMITVTAIINVTIKDIYNNLNSIEPDFFIFNEPIDKPSQHIKDLAKKDHANIYYTDKCGHILYPNKLKHKNIKPIILDNINYANAVPTYKDERTYFVFIYKNHSSINIANKNQIQSRKLLQSVTTHDYNKYDYNYHNNKLSFRLNHNKRPILNKDQINDDPTDNLKEVPLILLITIIIDVFLALITSYLVSKRLTKPLSYYIDWISNLSHEKLHQPTTKGNIKKYSKTFPELHTSLTTLNQQLLQDKIYQNQIHYYKSKWISQISHDLKSPLTSIYGYSKIIEVNQSNQKYVALISEKAKYMEELIQSLNKDFDNETNQMKNDKESFPIQSTVEKFVQTLGYENIDLTFLFDYDESFYGNKLYFERTLINLIENSIEHNNRNPKIDILFDKIENTLLIDYKDDGKGISNINDDIFKSGYSTKETQTENHGLGLTIVKEAVEYHNGTIHIIPSQNGVHFKIKFISTI
ncbi:HAMP domain-containing histidine kinase [Staphylococcus epidermidis]|nr:HAMP domain-containing histidine kinase [Staphylococcus epidermidis]